jgi:hypothetical protein
LVRDQLLPKSKAIIKLKKHHQLLFLRKRVKSHQILILQIVHQKFRLKKYLLRNLLPKRPPHHQTSLKTVKTQTRNQKVKNSFKLQEQKRKKKKKRSKKEVLNYSSKVSHLIQMNIPLELILNLMVISPNVNWWEVKHLLNMRQQPMPRKH